MFIKWRRSSSAYVNKICFMQKNCNFATMLGLANDEHWFTDSQSACGETLGFQKNYENVFEWALNEHVYTVNTGN